METEGGMLRLVEEMAVSGKRKVGRLKLKRYSEEGFGIIRSGCESGI